MSSEDDSDSADIMASSVRLLPLLAALLDFFRGGGCSWWIIMVGPNRGQAEIVLGEGGRAVGSQIVGRTTFGNTGEKVIQL